MAQSVTLRRKNPYITRSNRYIIRTTPSGKKVTIKKKKLGNATKCGSCKKTLMGVAAQRPAAYARLKKSQRKVSRAYGGNLCAPCCSERLMTAFLDVEEKLMVNDEIEESS
ncbi:hypothetical protein COBT_000172 [Conglomerata obtusa]